MTDNKCPKCGAEKRGGGQTYSQYGCDTAKDGGRVVYEGDRCYIRQQARAEIVERLESIKQVPRDEWGYEIQALIKELE